MSETVSMPSKDEQAFLDGFQVCLLTGTAKLGRFNKLLDKHHYLGSLKPFGERLYYVK